MPEFKKIMKTLFPAFTFFVCLSLSAIADDTFQISYAANLNVGDSVVNFTNSGATVVNGASQNLCANLYTFDPAEELISCCGCMITPNALTTLSVVSSLLSNPLTPSIPTGAVIKIVATSDATCDPATPTTLAHGVLAWSTTLHQNTSTAAATYSVTELPFKFATLTAAELTHISSTCSFIQANGTGFGLCKGCVNGGLGASTSLQ
jgi:hypothetical protein